MNIHDELSLYKIIYFDVDNEGDDFVVYTAVYSFEEAVNNAKEYASENRILASIILMPDPFIERIHEKEEGA
jgi:hypothetical protein